MQKILLLTIFISTNLLASYGQNNEIMFGPMYGLRASETLSLLGIEDNHYYVYSNSLKAHKLLTFDLEHELVAEQDLERKYNKRYPIYVGAATKSNKFLYASVKNKKLKQRDLLVRHLKDGALETRKLLSFDSKLERGPAVLSIPISPFRESNNGEYIAFISQKSIKENNLTITVFDKDFNIVWNKDHQFDPLGSSFKVRNFIVDNDGAVLFLVNHALQNDTDKMLTKVVKISNTDSKSTEVIFSGDNFSTNLDFTLLEDSKKIIVGGIYSENTKAKNVMGVFSASIDADLLNNNQKAQTYPFSDDFREGLLMKRKKGFGEDFEIKNVIKNSDGSISFLIEETNKSTANTSSRYDSDITYTTNGIIIPRFTSDGELINLEKIKKSISSKSFSDISYVSATHKNKTYLIFNNDDKIDDYKDNENIKNKQSANPYIVILNENGAIESYSDLIFNADKRMRFSTRSSFFDDDKFLVIMQDGTRYSFGFLKF